MKRIAVIFILSLLSVLATSCACDMWCQFAVAANNAAINGIDSVNSRPPTKAQQRDYCYDPGLEGTSAVALSACEEHRHFDALGYAMSLDDLADRILHDAETAGVPHDAIWTTVRANRYYPARVDYTTTFPDHWLSSNDRGAYRGCSDFEPKCEVKNLNRFMVSLKAQPWAQTATYPIGYIDIEVMRLKWEVQKPRITP